MFFAICSLILTVCHAKEGHYLPSPPGTRPNCIPMDTTYCEDIENYPVDIITKLLMKSNGTFVFSDERHGLQEPPSDLVLGRSLARGGFSFLRVTRSVTCQDNSLCPVQSRTVYPKAAIDRNGMWRYVQKSPVQIKQCRNIKRTKQKSFQRYTIKQLYALDGLGNINLDWFVFPSCCTCNFVN